MKNVKRIDFDYYLTDSDGKAIEGTGTKVCVLFNTTVIPVEEVYELINSGMFDYDNRIIVTTPKRADNLRSR